MAVNFKAAFGLFATFALLFAIFMPAVQGHGHDGLAPAPAPTSDGQLYLFIYFFVNCVSLL